MENEEKKGPNQTTTSEQDSAYSSGTTGAQRSHTESSGTFATRSHAGSSGKTSRATRSQGDSSGRGGRRSQASNDGREGWGAVPFEHPSPSVVSASHTSTSVPSSTSVSHTPASTQGCRTSQTLSSHTSTPKGGEQVEQVVQAGSSPGRVTSTKKGGKGKGQPFKKKKLELNLNREANVQQHPAEQDLSKRFDEGRFCVAVSLIDGQVRQTSDSLTTDLGFPGDMWIGRNILDFIHVDDRDTFTSRVTENIHLEMVRGEKHTFAVRVRQYNGLGKGFVVRTSYKPFLLSTFFRGLGSSPEKADQFGKYVFIVAEPIHCAFSKPLENGPLTNRIGKTYFWTQHQADYSLSWLDPAAVSFIGFLNQHIIGQSIFKCIHPHDLGTIAETFANLCQSRQACYSKGVRMRIRNGSYITVESMWTTFINPWTQKLEFVMGRHEVLLGPQYLDNFFGGKGTGHQSREVVVRPIKESPRKRRDDSMDRGESGRMDMVMDEMLKQTRSLKDNLNHQVFLPNQNFFGSSSDSPSYETLNYRASISRFLNSQPSRQPVENSDQVGQVQKLSITGEVAPHEVLTPTRMTKGALAQHDNKMAAMLKLQYNQERNDSYRARYPHGNMEAFNKMISAHPAAATSLAQSRDVSSQSTLVDPGGAQGAGQTSQEESDSSDLYTFLQTSSDVGMEPPTSGGAGVKRKLDYGWKVNRPEPFWNQRVDLTTRLVKQYKLPYVDCEETIQNDLSRLAEMPQPQDVEEQLEQLIRDIKGDGLKLEEFMEDLRSSPASEPELSTESEPENSGEKNASDLRKMIWKQNYLVSMSIMLEEDAPFPEPTPHSLSKEVQPTGEPLLMPPASSSSNASDL